MSRRDTPLAPAAPASPARRGFLKASAGLVVAFHIPFGSEALAQAAAASAPAQEVNAWVVVNPDDSIIIRIARSEMGQGTLTGLAQLVAEELDADWSKVTTEYPSPGASLARKRPWGSYSTGGSQGIRGSHDYVRKGGASARMMLIQAAADEWKVPVSECTAADSVITHTPTGRKTSYGKVALAAAKLPVPKEVTLKDPKTWKLAGKPGHREQDDRRPDLRHGPETARHAERVDQGLPDLWRQSEEL